MTLQSLPFAICNLLDAYCMSKYTYWSIRIDPQEMYTSIAMTTFIQEIKKSTSTLVVFLGVYNQLMQYETGCLTFSILLLINCVMEDQSKFYLQHLRTRETARYKGLSPLLAKDKIMHRTTKHCVAWNENSNMPSWDISLMVVSKRAVHLFAFLGFNLPQVELQFFALKDIAIGTATLSRSGGNAGWRETTID